MSEISKDTTNKDIETTSDVTSGNTLVKKEDKPKKSYVPPHKEYTKRLLKYRKYYIQLISLVSTLAAIGVAVAIIYNLLFGILLALLAAFLYAFLAPDEMYKTIGIKYKSVAGGIKLTSFRAIYG